MRTAVRIHSPRLAQALETISRVLRQEQRELDSLVEQRNKLVREALAEGWSLTQVAEVSGLTRARIGQLVEREMTQRPFFPPKKETK